MEVFVDVDGTIEFIYSDTLASLFDGENLKVTRASYVEPAIGGGWTADLSPVGGPVLLDNGAPFVRREDALAAESRWLEHELSLRRIIT
jgi:hypothetical protein